MPTLPDSSRTSPQAGRRDAWLKRSQQRGLLTLVSSGFLTLACYWMYLGGHRGRLVEIDRVEPLMSQYLVDINRADWPEIVQMSGVGETLARRIIANRLEHGPFKDVEDLDRVDGIGLRTLERMRPYLIPIPQDTNMAGLENGEIESVP